MKSETHRLNKLTGASRNIAKRYKLTKAAAEIIDQAGRVHGQKSRAVQIAVELLWRTSDLVVEIPDAILDSPTIGRTYALPKRTIALIEALAHEHPAFKKFGSKQGAVLAACALLLDSDVKEAKKGAEYWHGHENAGRQAQVKRANGLAHEVLHTSRRVE